MFIKIFKRLFGTWRSHRFSNTVDLANTTTDETIQLLLDIRAAHHERKDHRFDKTFKLFIFSDIVRKDIATLAKYMHLDNSIRDRNLFGRLMSMTIIEFLEDMNMLIGEIIRAEWKDSVLEDFIPEIKAINKKYASLKKDNNKQLREIRNNASAHKTKDLDDLLFYTSEANYDGLIFIVHELINYHAIMQKLSTKVITKLTEEAKEIHKVV